MQSIDTAIKEFDFVEIGPKDVLTGLVRRISKEVKAVACGTVEGVQSLVNGDA